MQNEEILKKAIETSLSVSMWEIYVAFLIGRKIKVVCFGNIESTIYTFLGKHYFYRMRTLNEY